MRGRLRKLESGMGLIELMLALAIGGIVMLGMSAMFEIQNKQTRSIRQQLEVLELKSAIQTSQMNASNCTCLLNPTKNNIQTTPALQFNSTSPPSSMEIVTLFGACDSSDNPTQPLAIKDQALTGSTTGLRVSQILLNNIQNISGNEFAGTFEIQFAVDTQGPARRPIILQQRFLADLSNPSAATVISCLGPNAGGGGGAAPATASVETNCLEADKGGQKDCTLGSSSEWSICVLTGFNADNKTEAWDGGECRIFESGGNWILRTTNGESSKDAIQCSARCLK